MQAARQFGIYDNDNENHFIIIVVGLVLVTNVITRMMMIMMIVTWKDYVMLIVRFLSGQSNPESDPDSTVNMVR